MKVHINYIFSQLRNDFFSTYLPNLNCLLCLKTYVTLYFPETYDATTFNISKSKIKIFKVFTLHFLNKISKYKKYLIVFFYIKCMYSGFIIKASHHFKLYVCLLRLSLFENLVIICWVFTEPWSHKWCKLEPQLHR